jgi:hypothetical protein
VELSPKPEVLNDNRGSGVLDGGWGGVSSNRMGGEQMTFEESQELKVGDRVTFRDGVSGTVKEVNCWIVAIDWDDGQSGCIHHRDMNQVERG